MGSTTLESITKPHFILFNKRKNFFVCYRILVTHYHKFFIILHQLSKIFSEQRERRIGDNDVGLLQQGYTFGVSEVAGTQDGEDVFIVLQQIAHVGEVNSPVAVHVADFRNLHFIGYLFRVTPTVAEIQEQLISLHGRTIVACTNQFLQP